jgi:hypothetical protein
VTQKNIQALITIHVDESDVNGIRAREELRTPIDEMAYGCTLNAGDSEFEVSRIHLLEEQ